MSDFDVLGTVGKLALPIFARFRICGKSELGLVRYGPASRVHRGVFGPFEGSFPIGIPAGPDKFLAIREFHVVHGCVLLSNVPGLADQLVASQEDSVRKRGNVGGKIPELSAKPYFVGLFSRAWPCTEASLGSQDMILRTEAVGMFLMPRGVVSSIQFLVWSTVRSNLGQTWSTLVKLGLRNSWKCIPELHFKGFWARWTLVGLGKQARSNLGQTSVNSSQTWSTLVKLGQTLGNVSRTFFLGVFDGDEPSSEQADLVRAASFCVPTPEKIPGPIWEATFAQRFSPTRCNLVRRAKTLRQEVHFSYHMQLSDRQEFLRSSRNLSQKMTPWHEGTFRRPLFARSYLANPNSPLCKACTVKKVFLTRNKLICEPGHIGKKTHPCTTWNSRIAKNLSGPAGIPIGKLPSNGPKTPRWTSASRGHISQVQARISANPEPCKNRQRKLSDGTKNVKIRHRELGQICARTGTRFEKKRAGSKTHFFSRTAAFARRVFPARNKLIREPGCVGKIMTPATTWNSRFADSIPRLTGICIGRVHKNSSDTPTSGSHNSLVRTPIRANFISLERGRRELSDDMPHDPF
uniref:Uncharacterized protein n=1 Tax=Fagus sylvatica TaxID=28930 RepID=A0A2N9GU02_FAGSY